jgi:hypothetical protein
MTAPLSYKSRVEADADRAAQIMLLNALSAWERALRRDECGAWRVNGQRGHIYTWGDGKSWLLYIQADSPRHWSSIKKQLSFCRVTQDGDDEGCLRLFGLPTPEQAKAIRKVLAIRKRVEKSAETIEAERARLTFLRSAAGEPAAKGGFPAEKSANASSGSSSCPRRLPEEISARNPLSVEEGP